MNKTKANLWAKDKYDDIVINHALVSYKTLPFIKRIKNRIKRYWYVIWLQYFWESYCRKLNRVEGRRRKKAGDITYKNFLH